MAGTYALSGKDPSEASRKEAERDFDAALALLPESVANDERNEFWEDRWFETLNELIRGYRKLGVDAAGGLRAGRCRAGQGPRAEGPPAAQFRGDFWYDYGWEARTTAFAPAVPAGGFETFEERLDDRPEGVRRGLAAPAR